MKSIASLDDEGQASCRQTGGHVLLGQSRLFGLLGNPLGQSKEVFHLIPRNRKTTQRELNVFHSTSAGLARFVGRRHGDQLLLTGHRHDLLHLFEGLRKRGGGESKDLRNLLGLTRRSGLLEAHIETRREHRIATETLTPTDVLECRIEILGFFQNGLVDARIQTDQRETLTGLNKGSFLIRDSVP